MLHGSGKGACMGNSSKSFSWWMYMLCLLGGGGGGGGLLPPRLVVDWLSDHFLVGRSYFIPEFKKVELSKSTKNDVWSLLSCSGSDYALKIYIPFAELKHSVYSAWKSSCKNVNHRRGEMTLGVVYN